MTTTKTKTSAKKNNQAPNHAQASPPAAPAPAVAPPTPAAQPDPPVDPTVDPNVDPNAALVQYVQQTVTSLDTIEVGLGNDPALTPAQKRHALKFRKGGENIIGQIGNLAQQQQLESQALNVSDMMAMLGKAQALQPLSNRVAAFAKHIDDVIFTSESGSLSMAQQFYALLQRRALTDRELAAAIVPVVTFFARKPKPKAPGAPTKRQKKATTKAVNTLKKTAPQMLQPASPATQGQAAAAPAAQSAPVASTPAVATPAATGSGAAAAAATTGSHS